MYVSPYPLRASLAALVLALGLAACAEEPATTTAVATSDPDLRLYLPTIDPSLLVATDGEAAEVVSPAGPARADELAEGDVPMSEEEDVDLTPYLNTMSSIYDARTSVGFNPGYAWAWGRHKYQGNKGRVETTVTVSQEGRQLGNQTAAAEEYGLYFLDFGLLNSISVMARFYTDITCGLTVGGRSLHAAWWEWFLGGPVPKWGRTEQTSYANPRSQDECAPPQEESSGTFGSGGGGGTICWYSIDYDLATGEVIDIHLLTCTEEGG